MKHYTYKFRIYPTDKQITLLDKHFGCTRWIYNHFLEERNKFYLNAKENQLQKKYLNYYDNANELPKLKKDPKTEWLSEVNAQSLQHVIKNLDSAFNRFFKRISRFPKFKKKNGKNSFCVPQNTKIEKNLLYIRKFSEGIKICQHREIDGIIKKSVITKTKSGKYYVSVEVEREIVNSVDIKNDIIAIDLGVKNLVTCSDGVVFKNPKHFKKYERRLNLLHKAFLRTKKNSKGREKTRKKLATLHEKISNIRKDNLNKITRKIIDENQIIVFEDLNIQNMLCKNRNKINKSIFDCSFGELLHQIKYKSIFYDRKNIQVDRWFPSSKTCNCCGYINEKLKVDIRSWECPQCKIVHDRDKNAAKNILKQGLNLLDKDLTVGTTEIANSLSVSLPLNKEASDCVRSRKTVHKLPSSCIEYSD